MSKSPVRRFERFALGIVFGLVAWIVERRVLKAIRRRGGTEPRTTTLADHATSELERPSA
jgi:hypothetical protein